MGINRDSLSARVGNIAKEKGISPNAIYSRYFLDCFLKRHDLFSKMDYMRGVNVANI